MMLENPFRTEEWTYYVGNRLIAVAYVDALPEALSAIYCYYDPRRANVRWGRSTSCRSSPLLASGGSRTSTSVTT
jgi:Putative arginyl-tRNA:protein arginylyltransferase